jgi:hypothetical protein
MSILVRLVECYFLYIILILSFGLKRKWFFLLNFDRVILDNLFLFVLLSMFVDFFGQGIDDWI